jgi:hypothetical protein
MGNKNMKKNIYQKLHSACIEAGGVLKADKVSGMRFNPLLHDAVQEKATQALLNNNLYATCNYVTEITDKNMVMVICTMKVHDIEDPTQFIIVDGCSAMGAIDKFGTGNAMSYSRKYAFLNLLNLKTGIKDEDGYEAKPFKEIPKAKANGTGPTYLDEEINVEGIKDEFKNTKTLTEFNIVNEKYKNDIQYLIKNNLRAYRQVSDIAGTHKIKLQSNNK